MFDDLDIESYVSPEQVRSNVQRQRALLRNRASIGASGDGLGPTTNDAHFETVEPEATSVPRRGRSSSNTQ